MDSLICNPNEVHIAYDYIKQVYKECDDNNLEPVWVKMLDRFVKRLNELSYTKYFKSMFMQDLKDIQCKSPISKKVFDEYFATKTRYIYGDLAIDIIHKLIGSDVFATEHEEVIYAFDSTPQQIAYMLLDCDIEHSNRTLLELFVDNKNIEKWEQFGITKETLAKIHNSVRLVRDIKYFLRCVNASINSIKPSKYIQQFEVSTSEIIYNDKFNGLGSEEGYKKAIISGFSRYAYQVKPKKVQPVVEVPSEEELRQQAQAMREKEELKRLREQKRLLKEQIERQKQADPNFRTGEQHYAMMINEIIELTNILIDKAKVKRRVSAQEGCYLFNELDFLLIKTHSAHTLIGVLNSKIDDFYKEPFDGRFSKSQLSRTLEFLKSANKASKANAIVSQIQFVIDGKMTPPTEEQVNLVKQYLKQHKIALNEVTYTYALRRLIIGGDINSKFEIGCLVKLNESTQEKTETVKP